MKMLQTDNYTSFLENKEVPLHQQVISQKRLATYQGEIGAGIGIENELGKEHFVQTFKMLFDTGSCEFWIPMDKCVTERCKTHQRYKRTKTFRQQADAEMSIQQLSGRVAGQMGKETIILGDLIVPNQVVGIAYEVAIPLLDEVIWDGILGLAYPNQNLRNQGIKPIFDNIISQHLLKAKGEKNQFGYQLGPDRGSITFGGADLRQKRTADEEFVWAPVTEENQWTISLIDVRLQQNDPKFKKGKKRNGPLCPRGCKTILDTGTYLIQGPADDFDKYFNHIKVDSCDDKSKLPNIIFELLGLPDVNGNPQIVELTLTPDDYVLQFEIAGEDDCVLGIGPDNEDTGWTLGQVFLKAFYTVFDRENKGKIGFVRSNSNPDPPPGSGPDSEYTRRRHKLRFKEKYSSFKYKKDNGYKQNGKDILDLFKK